MTLTSSYAEGTDTPGPSAGLEEGTATVQPSGDATSKIADFGLPGVFDVSGAQSSAYAQQVTGQLREAQSTADINEISLGGQVDLKGLHWEDTQETGPGGAIMTQSASFSISALTIGVQSIPVASDDAAQLTDIINTALSGEGIHVTIPSPVTQQSGEEDLGPMSIGIDNSSLLSQALGPAWTDVDNGVGPVQGYGATINDIEQDQNPYTGQPLVHTGNPTTDDEIATDLCQLNTPTAVASILAAVLTGGGTLDLNLGGTTALSQGTAYSNPFGSVGTGLGGAIDLGSSSASPQGSSGPFPGTPGTPGSPGIPASSGSSTSNGSGGTPRSLAMGRTSERCTSSCGGGDALPVGLIGLGVVSGTGLADYARTRRNRRFDPITAETREG